MKKTLTLKLTLALIPMMILGSGAAFAGPPRSGSVAVSRTGPAGNTASRQSSLTTNGQGGYSASSTATGPRGNTTTRQQSGSYDAATKTYTRSGGTNGASGKSTSFNTQVQASGNGYTRSATRTGPQGNSVSSRKTVTTSAPPAN